MHSHEKNMTTLPQVADINHKIGTWLLVKSNLAKSLESDWSVLSTELVNSWSTQVRDLRSHMESSVTDLRSTLI